MTKDLEVAVVEDMVGAHFLKKWLNRQGNFVISQAYNILR